MQKYQNMRSNLESELFQLSFKIRNTENSMKIPTSNSKKPKSPRFLGKGRLMQGLSLLLSDFWTKGKIRKPEVMLKCRNVTRCASFKA